MIKINSCEFNYQYRDKVFFPYSIASLVSYTKAYSELAENFKFEKTFVSRPKVDEYVKQCEDSDILLCSCYVWNWEITIRLAENVKKINPKCLIVFGGPQAPDRADGFFEKYPFIDVIVHNEGEITLKNILESFLGDKDYSKIDGLETKDFKTPPQKRMDDLNISPSPYLTNLVWDLTEKIEGIKYMAIWETNRGCPYQCTFCDWGSLTYTKLRNYSEDRLFKEIEWFADNKISFIHCADANFGIFQQRDLAIATKMKEEKLAKGFPEAFRLTWAKFSSDKIIPLAQELQKAGLMHAVTLAVQSLDPSTLDIVKRENIKFDTFSELTETFRTNKIPTYTEIIMGLPGETLESLKKGFETMSETQIGSVYIYNCGILPNAPMNEPSYRNYYKIKSIRSPIYLAHSSIHNREMPEYEEFVISTSSFSEAEFKQMHIWSWFMQTFHSLGILETILHFYKKSYNLSFIKFFETFHEFCKRKESIFSEQYNEVVKHVDMGCDGQGWNYHDPTLGDLVWPIEEVTWLRLVEDGQKLKLEILSFLEYLENKFELNTKRNILDDLAKFQVFILTTRDDKRDTKSHTFKYAWKDFFTQKSQLRNIQKNYYYKNLVNENNYVEWGYEAIWFGRASQKYKFHLELLQEPPTENLVSFIH